MNYMAILFAPDDQPLNIRVARTVHELDGFFDIRSPVGISAIHYLMVDCYTAVLIVNRHQYDEEVLDRLIEAHSVVEDRMHRDVVFWEITLDVRNAPTTDYMQLADQLGYRLNCPIILYANVEFTKPVDHIEFRTFSVSNKLAVKDIFPDVQ